MVTDGMGGLCEAIIMTDDATSCIVQIARRMPRQPPLPCDIHIAMAPTKNMNRFEWFLEKSTELGVSEITPLICHRSERRTLKTGRQQKVILSAMKQSFSTFLPKLNEIIDLPDFLTMTESTKAVRLIGHCEDTDRQTIKNVYPVGADVVFLIGPEGDFTPGEVQKALEHGFVPVTLGRNRLRTETAGLVACHTINLLNETI